MASSVRSTAGLFAALLPALERTHGHAQQGGELGLRQAGGLAGLGGSGKHDLALPAFMSLMD